MKYSYLAFLLILGCLEKTPSDYLVIDLSKNSAVEVEVLAEKLEVVNYELSYSNYSFIQANKSGLYVTPSTGIDGAILYRFKLNSDNQPLEAERIVNIGQGPNELEAINISSKSITGDTLFFNSLGNKTLIINAKGKVSEFGFNTEKVFNFGYSMSYNNGRLLIPSFSPIQVDFLFRVYHLNSQESYPAFTPRVPYGYQPSIRNEILGETPIPNGFAISFLGDREVYILDMNGNTTRKIILGESDVIPKPYKTRNQQGSGGARPYITKMEFFNNHLMVLLDNVIWVIEFPSFEVKTKIRLLTNEHSETIPVIDFSVSEDYTYSRIGREGIYFIPTSLEWFTN